MYVIFIEINFNCRPYSCEANFKIGPSKCERKCLSLIEMQPLLDKGQETSVLVHTFPQSASASWILYHYLYRPPERKSCNQDHIVKEYLEQFHIKVSSIDIIVFRNTLK